MQTAQKQLQQQHSEANSTLAETRQQLGTCQDKLAAETANKEALQRQLVEVHAANNRLQQQQGDTQSELAEVSAKQEPFTHTGLDLQKAR